MAAWEDYLLQQKGRLLEELLAFLRIPSISALPAHKADVQRAAEWVSARMKKAGIESVRVMATGGHPVVYGEWLHAPGKPIVMVYGHFDVQPVDPLDLWHHPPFEPHIQDGRIYARGTTDDKGNLFIPLIVAEAMLKTAGKLPVNLKFFFEGQEEIGSPQLPDFIAAHKELLACDMVLSADGGQWDEDHPALILGTRGLAAIFIDIQGPDHDLHSGTYGGTIVNPIHALARIIDSMHDAEGRIAVEGFYDDVRPLSAEERAQMALVPYDEARYLRETGSVSIFGEPGFTTYERAWARPTLEVNGLYGGFQGEGSKTVLPSTAHAKITCRLVADQDPSRIAELLERHVHKVKPGGVKVVTDTGNHGAFPYLIPSDHSGLQAAGSVLKDLYGREPYRIRMGGTIPANAMFLQLLRAYTIVFAFGLEDEHQHSPNEFFRLSSFERGQKGYGMLLSRLGGKLD
jgi:acetylornithine deacetylase/succinyl-diaminopimelate desuccinylase-like protein